jgi:hypothetical protein
MASYTNDTLTGIRIRPNGKRSVAIFGPTLSTRLRNDQLKYMWSTKSTTFNYMNDTVRNDNAGSKHRYPAPSEQRIHLEDEIADLKQELLLAQSSRSIDRILERIERLTKKKDHIDSLEEWRRKAPIASEDIRQKYQYDLRREREEKTRAGFDKSHRQDVNLDTGLASTQEEYLNEIATLRAEKDQLRKAILYQTNLEEQETLARKMRLDEEEMVKGTRSGRNS